MQVQSREKVLERIAISRFPPPWSVEYKRPAAPASASRVIGLDDEYRLAGPISKVAKLCAT